MPLFLLLFAAGDPAPPPQSGQFKPGIAVIVAVLTTVFSVTFLLLLYMKHCRRESHVEASRGYFPASGRHSGVDRKVVESLPMFRFSSLTGKNKHGLECAVCLNVFGPDEVLRLLPKCKHAFHVECVDTWLDAHSTCPLCRYRVDPEDVLLLDTNGGDSGLAANRATPRNSNQGKGKVKEYTNLRISGRHSSAGERVTSLEMIVENRGRISLDSWHSRRKSWKNPKSQNLENQKSKGSRKDGQLLAQKEAHRLEHRIVISSDRAAPRRWSDAEAAEILYLRAEKVITGSGRAVNQERSVSEMTGVSRYVSNNGGGEQGQEQRAVVRRWLDWISQSQSQLPAGQSESASAIDAGSSMVV